MRLMATGEANSEDWKSLLAFRVTVGIAGRPDSGVWRVNPATLGDAAIRLPKDGYMAYELNNSKLLTQ